MVMKNFALILILLVFGLPFLVITDLFPLHRYGMFARIPENPAQVERYSFETKTLGSKWQKLQTGNPYFDDSYLPALAEKVYHLPADSEKWVMKLRSVPKEKPDSIRILRISGKSVIMKPVFP